MFDADDFAADGDELTPVDVGLVDELRVSDFVARAELVFGQEREEIEPGVGFGVLEVAVIFDVCKPLHVDGIWWVICVGGVASVSDCWGWFRRSGLVGEEIFDDQEDGSGSYDEGEQAVLLAAGEVVSGLTARRGLEAEHKRNCIRRLELQQLERWEALGCHIRTIATQRVPAG